MNALHILNDMERSQRKELPLKNIDPRAKLLVTLFFLVTMLSLPIVRLSELILFFIYPILTAAMYGIDYVKVFRRSLIVIPLVALIALPNIFALLLGFASSYNPMLAASPLNSSSSPLVIFAHLLSATLVPLDTRT